MKVLHGPWSCSFEQIRAQLKYSTPLVYKGIASFVQKVFFTMGVPSG